MQLNRDRSFYRQLLALTLPIFLQQLLRISVDTVNSLMLGRIDQIQMSAISQANQVFFIYYTISCGLAAGCAVLVAQFWGKKDVNVIPSIIAHSLRMVMAIEPPIRPRPIMPIFITALLYLTAKGRTF